MIPIATPDRIDLTEGERSLIDTCLEGIYDCARSGEGNPGNSEWYSMIEGMWVCLHDFPEPRLTPDQARILLEITADYDDDEDVRDSLARKLEKHHLGR